VTYLKGMFEVPDLFGYSGRYSLSNECAYMLAILEQFNADGAIVDCCRNY
jgi:hypothetical protein